MTIVIHLKPKTRIILDSEGPFLNGDNISGQVVIDVKKEYNVRAIKVYFCGGVNTEEQSHNAEGHTDRDKRDYVKLKLVLMEPMDNKLLPGKYNFPFSFVIPMHLPPTYQGKYGKISYDVRARVEKVKWVDTYEITPVSVSPIVDSNRYTSLMEPVTSNCHGRVGWLLFGDLSFNATISKSFIVKGDVLSINVEVEKDKHVGVSSWSYEVRNLIFHKFFLYCRILVFL